jgi:hypothetical protein
MLTGGGVNDARAGQWGTWSLCAMFVRFAARYLSLAPRNHGVSFRSR